MHEISRKPSWIRLGDRLAGAEYGGGADSGAITRSETNNTAHPITTRSIRASGRRDAQWAQRKGQCRWHAKRITGTFPPTRGGNATQRALRASENGRAEVRSRSWGPATGATARWVGIPTLLVD